MDWHILEGSNYGFNIVILLAGFILAGLFVGRLSERYNIPNISGYLLVGIIAGLVLLFFDRTFYLDGFLLITKFCLGFIALSIGLELDFRKLKARRNEVFIVTLTQATLAFLLTSLGLFVFGLDLIYALLLGSVAIATEPGPILSLTKRYKTKGELTDTLVPLHGIEDAFAIIVFGIVLSFSVATKSGDPMTFAAILHGPIYELIFSIIIGVVIGLVLRFIIWQLDYEDIDKDMVVFVSTVASIMASIAIANRGFDFFGVSVHLSPVLLPMVVGITFANTSTKLAKHETESMLDTFSPPVIIAFFTVVGAEMVFLLADGLNSVPWRGMILFGSVYVVFRIVGKVAGSYLGGMLGKSSRNVRRYLGFCLLPQAQAAIGLIMYARIRLEATPNANMMVVIVVVGTLVYELLGPFGLRHSLVRCDEVDANGACIIKDRRHRLSK